MYHELDEGEMCDEIDHNHIEQVLTLNKVDSTIIPDEMTEED